DIATFAPEPPTHLRARNIGGGKIVLAWQAPEFDQGDGVLGHAARSYMIYHSRNGKGFAPLSHVEQGHTSVTVEPNEPGVHYFKVAALNEGGESPASEVIAVNAGDEPRVLLVSGFDRLDRDMN